MTLLLILEQLLMVWLYYYRVVALFFHACNAYFILLSGTTSPISVVVYNFENIEPQQTANAFFRFDTSNFLDCCDQPTSFLRVL